MPGTRYQRQRGTCTCGRDHNQEDHEVWKMSYLDYIKQFYHDREEEEMEEDELDIIYREHTERLNDWANKLNL